ncbi:hypothetical protein BDY19DRAFT_994603 [Irpex rosettiformis]|uniref:Uncharacterized protein n=1 Tax=Irpex rosettiformis TaxID=378272 RepID=A0ACB8U0G9_9APHY|nr:hypothetical protein BDY19DRAFT_994603 [Irpex rosettiformis]
MPKTSKKTKELEEKLAAASKALDEMRAKEQETAKLLQAAQEREAEQNRQLEVARAQTAEAQAMAQAATIAASTAATQAVPELIDRPHGNFSLAAILQEHHILTDEQSAIHQFLNGYMGMLEEKKCFSYQDPKQVAAVRAAVSHEYPVLKKFRDQWPVTRMLQDRLRNRRIELQKLGVLEKPHRNYKTTPEQRSQQAKHANAISLQNRRMRSAQTNEVRRQEQEERDAGHCGVGETAV